MQKPSNYNIRLTVIPLLLVLMLPSYLDAQDFPGFDSTKKPWKVYTEAHFESYRQLILYPDHSFYFKQEAAVSYHRYSKGKWKKAGNNFILNSTLDSNQVPVKINYVNTDIETDSIKHIHPYTHLLPQKNPFWIPLNLNNSAFPDSRIFINGNSNYCFPYFDTCSSNYSRIDSIKIDFGNGFKTRWIKLRQDRFKQILVQVQSKEDLDKYFSFKNQLVIVNRNKIKIVKSSQK